MTPQTEGSLSLWLFSVMLWSSGLLVYNFETIICIVTLERGPQAPWPQWAQSVIHPWWHDNSQPPLKSHLLSVTVYTPPVKGLESHRNYRCGFSFNIFAKRSSNDQFSFQMNKLTVRNTVYYWKTVLMFADDRPQFICVTVPLKKLFPATVLRMSTLYVYTI